MALLHYGKMSPAIKCDICGKNGNLHCGICAQVNYCSAACQLGDWQNHRQNCVSGQRAPPLPPACVTSMRVTRGIAFFLGQQNIKHIWIPYSNLFPGYVRVDLNRFLAITPHEKAAPQMIYDAPFYTDLTRDIANNTDLPYTIRLHYRDGSLPAELIINKDRSSSDSDSTDSESHYGSDDEKKYGTPKTKKNLLNKAAQNLSALPGFVHDWKGPIIAFGIKSFTKDGHVKECVDLESSGSNDVRHIMSFFSALHDPIGKIACVRVNCDGDVHKGRPKFEPISVPFHHAIFRQAPTSISERIQLPVTVARIPGSIDMWDGKPNHPTANEAITSLYKCCDPKAPDDALFRDEYTWSWPPLTWEMPVGSCIVARKDKKALYLDHVAALCEYTQVHLTSYFECQFGKAPKGKPFVLTQVSQRRFRWYWEDWKEKQVDERKRRCVSPYEI